MYSILRARNDGLKADLINFAAEIVRVPSPSLREHHLARLVRQQMEEIGLKPVVSDEAGNVVGALFGRESGPTVLLVSHMDTLEPALEEDSRPVEIRDGRLYGSGAADCKGGLAAQLYAAALLKRSLLPLRGNLVVAAAVAEENGASLGVRTLIEKTLPSLGLTADFAILGEPTALGVNYGHDGWMEADLSVSGANLFQVDDVTRALFGEMEKRRFANRDGAKIEALVPRPPRFDVHRRLRRGTIRIARRLDQSNSAEEAINRIGQLADLVGQLNGSVRVDVRIPRIRQRLYTGKTAYVSRVTRPWSTDPFDPLLERSRQVLAAAGCPARPGKWQLDRLGMGTAGSVLVNEFHIPTIGYGPGDEEQAHRPDEFVGLDNMARAVYGTAVLVHGLIGIPVYGWTSDEI